ncbi:MAG: glycosyltransferase family A protein [Acidobacteriota bacterium]
MNSVSAIITCYNYGKYLDGCIQSVLGQSEPVHEIVIVDDGSTDDTEQVLQRYEDRERITIVRQQNKGQACAKNEGARRASGDLLAFLDADDRWDRHKTECNARSSLIRRSGWYMARCGTSMNTTPRFNCRPPFPSLRPAEGTSRRRSSSITSSHSRRQ